MHQALVRQVESVFIPDADYVTVASPEFGTWLATHYGVTNTRFIANVPSIAEAPEAVRTRHPARRAPPSLYWFSIRSGAHQRREDAGRARLRPVETATPPLPARG